MGGRRGTYRGRHRARRRCRPLRVGVAVAAIAGVVLAVTAFGPGLLERSWSSAGADERFVAAVQAEGRAVPTGGNEVLVVRAAQKLCERRDGAGSSAERRAAALTTDEIAAVRGTFGDDSGAFVKVALRTYCPVSP